MINKGIWIIVLLTLLSSCKEGTLFDTPNSDETGITFSNSLTETDDLNILDYLYFYNGGGVAVGDINNDDLPDIYFSGNQTKNALYLNKGNFTFEDITETAGVGGNSSWNTGAVMGDVNGDGLLDIYVCAVVGLNGFDGHNELYINNGDNTFSEQASKYGLDQDSYSSSAAFLDYDSDGDLDMYLLNHAVHTQESFGFAKLREKRSYETGDKLLRNDGETFTDVSEEAGIYGGVNGYGLGIAISDFNQDGWPDIYVGNDFHEDDYFYLNNQDGTFSEVLKSYFGHTTRFSMGSDVADINHDGWPDLISLDMLPEDEKVLKSSEGDDNIQTQKLRTERYGYHYQFTRNMLYVNRQGEHFSETALLSGIAATDWSWSALFADYDQDGEQDLFISNGIPKRPNDLDYINFVSNEQIQKKISNTKLVDQKALDLMPSGVTHNYVFQGKGDLKFLDRSSQWISNDTLVSGATAWADFDRDGDLDLVTNNLNRTPTLYRNRTNDKNNWLQVSLSYKKGNSYGIGAKVFSYHKGIQQYKELYTVRGFQASSEPLVHFGYKQHTQVDSIRVVWPDHTFQLITNVPVNQKIQVEYHSTQPFNYESLKKKKTPLFEKVSDNLGINFDHEEDPYLDFNRQKLIPYRISDRGPAIAIGDLNSDGKEDVFFGSSKFKPSQMFLQSDTTFISYQPSALKDLEISEDVSAAISDFDKDNQEDLFIGTAGADFYKNVPALQDRVLFQRDSLVESQFLADVFTNTSVVASHDYDGDGDEDLFVGNQAITNDFGATPTSYFLKNDEGSFTIDPRNPPLGLGMVTDAVWDDINGDGTDDLIVVGEWMNPVFLINSDGVFQKGQEFVENLNGLWQCVEPFDIDQDGDTDYLIGNWGTNSKFVASSNYPMRMYLNDFDTNGQTETIVATQKGGKYYPLAGLDELTSQLVYLKKKYTNYHDFAGQDVTAIFGKTLLKESTLLEVEALESGYLKNENGQFTFVPFGTEMQQAPIRAFCTFDFDGDGKEEALAAGNYFGVKPYHGRLDSFSGALIRDENTVIMGHLLGLDMTQKSARHLNILNVRGNPYLLATFNNDKIQLYKIAKQ